MLRACNSLLLLEKAAALSNGVHTHTHYVESIIIMVPRRANAFRTEQMTEQSASRVRLSKTPISETLHSYTRSLRRWQYTAHANNEYSI